jgi:outer membrane protein assembly factor BamB
LALTLLMIAWVRRLTAGELGASGEGDDPAMTALVQIFFISIGSTVILVWFFLLSGLGAGSKLGGLALGVLLVVGLVSSIRKVELTGDFIPVFEFRWSPDSQALLKTRPPTQPNIPTISPLTADEERLGNPGFRGPHRDGVLIEQLISENWQQPPQCLWRHPVGGGYAGFAVVGSLLVTLEQRGKEEALVGYDAGSGAERWRYQYQASFEDTMTGDGPRATPSVHENRVYSVGATSQFVCVEASTGKLLWHVDLLKENAMGIVDCGMAGSPLLFEDLVIIHAGTQNGSESSRSLLAFDRFTGKRVWGEGKEPIGYVSPCLLEIGGVPQVVIFDKTGLAGHDPRSGKELWRYALPTPQGVLAAQPILLPGDRIFFSAHETCQVAKISRAGSGWMAEKVWETNTLKCNFASAVWWGDCIYGLDKGILTCIEEATGKRKWKKSRLGHGQILRLGDRLLIQSEQGEIVLAVADPKAPKELGRFSALTGKTWNMPALVDGVLYVRNHHEMAAYDIRP